MHNSRATTHHIFDNFYISNVNVEKAETAFSFTGLPNKLIESLHFKNIKIKSHHGIVGKNAPNLFFENAKINGNTDYITDSLCTKAVIKNRF